ncbi:MAG: acyl-CoA--6-aminopenicillanic acid acyl-transferase [Bacteroidales bacterium]|nr:acyl-CoA--6-aminopenicillanic acid acyl-transferase [Bacteroidales bacterium]
MNRNFLIVILLLSVALGNVKPLQACTSVIVSGKATKDGRPLIFKNRDTSILHNMTIVVQGRVYRYIGLVNAEDTAPVNVWGGHNEAGFGIINTAAYNLNGDGGDTDGDGILIRKALELCATLEDFERLLDTVKKPREVNSNFAVLDVNGGCAYYETGNYEYVKFDVNDPKVAPDGYLMRTNFGTTGNHKLDMGVERYCAITDFMAEACKEGQFDPQFLLCQIPRYMKHGVTKLDMADFMPENENDTRYFPFHDYIARYSTSSVIMVQGVKAGESPLATVSWTMVGWPLSTVAIPLVLTPSGKLPALVADDGTGHSRLNEMGLQLKDRVFSLKSGNTNSYGDLAQLMNKQGTGIMQRIQTLEKEVIRKGNEALDGMRKSKSSKTMEAYYDWVDEYLLEQYKRMFGIG